MPAQMLDYHDYTEDDEFVQTLQVPFTDAIAASFGLQWTLDADSRIRIYPSQSFKTYELDALNPAPHIAGLWAVIPHMLALTYELSCERQRIF